MAMWDGTEKKYFQKYWHQNIKQIQWSFKHTKGWCRSHVHEIMSNGKTLRH